MTVQLIHYDALTPAQRAGLPGIEVLAAQRAFCGDIEGALHTLLNRPGDDVRGLALLVGGVPQGFLLLKRGAHLPPWARHDAATLHALQVDWRAQGQGLGHWCLAALPARVREVWPQVRCLQLSVDTDNQAALRLYRAAGWVDSGEGYRGRVGYERQMTLML